MTASSPEDSDLSAVFDERLQRMILELTQSELDKNPLFNSHTYTHTLINIIKQMASSFVYLIEEGDEEKRREIYKQLLFIYFGEGGRKILDYLAEFGAATTYVLEKELILSQQAISYNISNLRRLGFVKQRDQAIPDKRLIKRGPREKIWVLDGATQKAVELAVLKDLQLKNPERAKAMEEGAEAEREKEKRQKEAEIRRLQEKAKYNSWFNAQVDEFLKSATTENLGYPEVVAYIRTIKEPLNDTRTLKYQFRDRLVDLGKWNPKKGSTPKSIKLPIPDDILSDVLKAREDGFTLCTCKATYSIKKECCPGCGERNIWKKYRKVRSGKASRWEEILATSSTTLTSHDPEESTPQNIDSKADDSPSAGTEPKSGV